MTKGDRLECVEEGGPSDNLFLSLGTNWQPVQPPEQLPDKVKPLGSGDHMSFLSCHILYQKVLFKVEALHWQIVS